VDIFVKAIDAVETLTYSEAVRLYLAAGRTRTARLLREKGVIVLYPAEWRGTILWRGPYEDAG
jgi:putative hemolysin